MRIMGTTYFSHRTSPALIRFPTGLCAQKYGLKKEGGGALPPDVHDDLRFEPAAEWRWYIPSETDFFPLFSSTFRLYPGGGSKANSARKPASSKTGTPSD